LENIKTTGARVCITANAGCLLQILREASQQGYPLQVIHPMDLLDASYRGVGLKL
jgi:Fe-S oxidoreductase